MVSATGDELTTFEPDFGSSGLGAPISTPGSGPATDGLSGFSDFVDSQPASTSASRHTTEAENFTGTFLQLAVTEAGGKRCLAEPGEPA